METLRSNAKRSGITLSGETEQATRVHSKRSAPEQEGFGDTLSPMGVQGASPLARVRGAEPRSLKPKPLDHPTPKPQIPSPRKPSPIARPTKRSSKRYQSSFEHAILIDGLPRGCSLVVKPLPSKQLLWVRFPPPAFI
jgi:hypothetical protein